MERGELMDDELPVSPMSQYCSSSVLSLTILVVFEFGIPIDDSVAISTLRDMFLPLSTRFSSVMVKDKQGIPKWKRVNVNLEEHVSIPVYPTGLESYDACFHEYLSKIAIDPLPENQPLWNIHLFKYPTRTAAGTLVFKLHHALGDGFSLMGALFSSFRRVDDPSLPPTFPSQNKNKNGQKLKLYEGASRIFSLCFNTFRDFGWSLLRNSFVEDNITPIRSGEDGVEFRPVTISVINFSLHDIKQIKNKIKGTVNDVMTGIIFYGIQLYMQASGCDNKRTRITGLVMLNTRAIKTYKTIQEMSKHNSKAPWGNHFSFLHVSISLCTDVERVDPLDFACKAKRLIKMKMNSLAMHLTGGLIEMMRKLKGPEVVSRYIHTSFKNTSFGMSNVIGPADQVQIAGHPTNRIYFNVIGAPQSLSATVLSYMGKLNVSFGTEKDFINHELLISCMEKSFERMYEAAVGNITKQNGI